MTDKAPPAKTPAAAIYALTIERFRGITSLKWKPSRGVNVILGGGDVGKTTILEAIALLLSPVNPTTLSDPDYHDRQIEAGFSIEAVLSLPAGAGISSQMKPSWPWEWSGEEATVPSLEHDGKPAGEPVYPPARKARRTSTKRMPAGGSNRSMAAVNSPASSSASRSGRC